MIGQTGIASQHTLKTTIECRGIGLHSGRKVVMTLRPAPADSGIVFRRVDAGAEIAACWSNAVSSSYCTALSNGEGIRVETIEHLMAALSGAEIDNAIIELDGPEIPIMDGSAAPFVFLIECAGRAEQDSPRRAIKILKPVSVSEGKATASLSPDHGFSMSFEIDFEDSVIRRQDMAVVFDQSTFKTELSRARTFGLLSEIELMRSAGLAQGGSLENAVVVSGDRVLNAGGLRFADEFVRHKMLDACGDLYLAGGPVLGHFHGTRSGHNLTRRLLAALFADDSAWRWTSMIRSSDFAAPEWQAAPRLARA